VRSDRRLLRRLLQNLVSNAIKYTRTGRVLVGCRRCGAHLRIGVYDTGIGIPPHQQRAVFFEFHRLEQGAKEARGLGLGLSIVERIARVLDQPLRLVSETGRGSHFSVDVPVAPAAPHRALAPETRLDHGHPRDRACLDRRQHSRRHDDAAPGLGLRSAGAVDFAGAVAAVRASAKMPSGLLVDYHLDRATSTPSSRCGRSSTRTCRPR
jgi:hypothetical protein